MWTTEAQSCWGPLRIHGEHPCIGLPEDRDARVGTFSPDPRRWRAVLGARVLHADAGPVRTPAPQELLQHHKVAWWPGGHQVCLAPHWCPRTQPQHDKGSGQQGRLRGTLELLGQICTFTRSPSTVSSRCVRSCGWSRPLPSVPHPTALCCGEVGAGVLRMGTLLVCASYLPAVQVCRASAWA